MHKLKGDTLIEVALAIGIFSMVAVAVVAVVSGSTSSAQSALELTVTREEIDAQAEALRFIQSSYLMGGMSNVAGFTQEKYSKIWQEITNHAIDLTTTNDSVSRAVLNYNPATCSELYESSADNYNYIKGNNQKAFIINTRNIGAPDEEYEKDGGSAENFIKDHIVLSAKDSELFQPAATYPRILFGVETDALYDSNTNSLNVTDRNSLFDISRVEGLFIIAVKDSKTTSVVNPDGGGTTKRSAYYDFYIRSCWFNPGADRPSTISTIVRLQDPAVILYE